MNSISHLIFCFFILSSLFTSPDSMSITIRLIIKTYHFNGLLFLTKAVLSLYLRMLPHLQRLQHLLISPLGFRVRVAFLLEIYHMPNGQILYFKPFWSNKYSTFQLKMGHVLHLQLSGVGNNQSANCYTTNGQL